MKRFFLFLLVAGMLSGPLYAGVPNEVQQQTKRAQITLRAIANQLAHFYAQHGYYPSTAFSDTAFAAIGMKEPPSKTWDYFFECKLYSCDITAEHKRRHYTPDDLVGITPILRLTVRKRKVDPIIHGEART
ncbi:MAG: hypothetical protein MJ053_04295, partial [Elusimicrobiaceae bacterium]|nr:hypothetical protein [Elusimicrobiaceae bacterium]